MGGAIIRALAKTAYDFHTLSAGATVDLVVAKGIDLTQWREGTAIVRIHTSNMFNPQSVVVKFLPDAPTSEDPATDFVYQSGGGSFPTVTYSPAAAASGWFYLAPLPANAGGWLKIVLTPSQSATPPANFSVTISIDISVKS